MLKSSAAYRRTMLSPLRPRAYMTIMLGVINQKAQQDCEVTSTLAPWSKGNIFGSEDEIITYATLEEKFNNSLGKYLFMPEVSQYKINGICTLNFGDSIRVDFGYTYDIKGLTVDFGEDYPSQLRITTSRGNEYVYTNEVEKFECETTFGEIDYLIITPIHMVNGDNARMRIKSMLMGVGLIFDNNSIESASIDSYISSISENVSYIDYKFSAFDTAKKFDVDNDESFMNYLEPLQSVVFSVGQTLDTGKVEWIQVGSGYVDSWSSQAGKISITATDKLAQLKNEYTLGFRIYDRTAYAECVAILEDAGYEPDEYDIDKFLQNITLHNPIPICAHREALQLVCNATRCIAYETAEGKIMVRANFSTVLDPDDVEVSASDETAWSICDNIKQGATVEYLDLSSNMGKTDENQTFLPEDSSEYSNETGFVSLDIADNNGEFTNNPYVMLTLPARFSYYSVTVDFGGVVPQELLITLYDDSTVLETYTYSNITESTNVIIDDFLYFNKIKFEVTKTTPSARVLINRVTFGNTSGYYIDKDKMLEDYCGFKEERIKDVKVKIYTFELDEDNKPKEVEDEVYYTLHLNASGTDRTCCNQLIHTQAQAEDLAEWLGNYFKNNTSYSVKFRGDPTLQTGDIIRLESMYKDNLQVEVEKNTLNYAGAFSGDLDLRRALRLSDMEA